MNTHEHFTSPVCGSYYLKLSRDEKTQGGNLLFTNPGLNICESSIISILRSFLKCEGIEWKKIQSVNEGEIILWSGALKHTIEPTAFMKDERISIIINTCQTLWHPQHTITFTTLQISMRRTEMCRKIP